LAAWSFIASAPSITNTRRDDSNGVRVGGRDDGLVDVDDEHLGGAARRDPRQIGVRAPRDTLGHRPGSRAPSASSAAANARAIVRLPVPGGPWKR
jgi:hypothetical protein